MVDLTNIMLEERNQTGKVQTVCFHACKFQKQVRHTWVAFEKITLPGDHSITEASGRLVMILFITS